MMKTTKIILIAGVISVLLFGISAVMLMDGEIFEIDAIEKNDETKEHETREDETKEHETREDDDILENDDIIEDDVSVKKQQTLEHGKDIVELHQRIHKIEMSPRITVEQLYEVKQYKLALEWFDATDETEKVEIMKELLGNFPNYAKFTKGMDAVTMIQDKYRGI